MTTIRLYWNNICVLHRQELQFLNEIREELRKDNIDLDITCFGLGYGRHMSDYLREEDSVLPDLVVSTDLEVFEDERIWNRFREHGLLPLKEFFPVKDIPELGGLKFAAKSFRSPSLSCDSSRVLLRRGASTPDQHGCQEH